ncbi:hypothetical protein [Phaeovulum sp.]|nr:hypothetical protein [Phaeovulum sp.]MDP1668635.1 hypothetical protein [Phaeovulum sp.]
MALSSRRNLVGAGLWAGLAGGTAEVLWIAIYRQLQGAGSADVARGITETVFPSLAAAPYSVALGLVIHMVLALGLGIAAAYFVARVFPRLAGSWAEVALIVAILASVWGMNFFVILPAINPAFVTIVPYGASLASKLLFGVSAALVFRRAARG